MAAILLSCPMTSRPVCPSVRRNLFVRGQIIDWISFWRFGRGGPTRIYGPANVTDADRQIYRLQSRAIRCLFVSRFTWIGRPISCQLQLPFRTFAERNQPALEKKIKTCRSSPTPWAAHPSAIKSPAPSTPSTKKKWNLFFTRVFTRHRYHQVTQMSKHGRPLEIFRADPSLCQRVVGCRSDPDKHILRVNSRYLILKNTHSGSWTWMNGATFF